MDDLTRYRNVHFIGIGGIGMSAIASVLIDRGAHVTGSDPADNAVIKRLQAKGAKIHREHRADNVVGADLVVTSTAIRQNNVEVVAARRAGIPVWRRARVLGQIMGSGKCVAICGTHGKTTTTAMTGLALMEAGFDPTLLIGAELDPIGGNARTGQGEWIVAEADESDGSFLDLPADRIIVTNIEADHLDYYKDLHSVVSTFAEFFDRVRPHGKLIACADSPALWDLLLRGGYPAITYGLENPEADLTARDIQYTSGIGPEFTVVQRGRALGRAQLRIPGHQNISNALATLALGLDIGCDFDAMIRALANYGGARRRFQVKGVAAGVTVVDDYAHHPTEITATLHAARSTLAGATDRRIVAAFQPHRYSRTKSFCAEFGQAFRDADVIALTDVYSAGEDPIEGVDGSIIHRAAEADGHAGAVYVQDKTRLPDFLRETLREGDLFITLGAGDIWKFGEQVLDELREVEAKNERAKVVEIAPEPPAAGNGAVAAATTEPKPRVAGAKG